MTLTAEQIEERKHYIGGSDVAAALGWSPFCTPYKLWALKTGREEPKPQTAQQARGDELEAKILDRYAQESGHALQRITETIRHREHPFLAANLDAKGVDAPIIVDAKSMNVFAAYKNLDLRSETGVPRYWLCQGFLYLDICSWADSCIFAVQLVNDRDPTEECPFYTFKVDRDDSIQRRQTARLVDWWYRYVVADLAPPLQCEADVRSMYPRGIDAKTKEATDEIMERFMVYLDREKQINALAEQQAEDKRIFMEFLGDAEVATWKGQEVYQWKQTGKQKSRTFNKKWPD